MKKRLILTAQLKVVIFNGNQKNLFQSWMSATSEGIVVLRD